MESAIEVQEFRINEISVPAFHASIGEYVGIKVGEISGNTWDELVLSLGGFMPKPEVKRACRTGLCVPLMLDFNESEVCKSAAFAIQQNLIALPKDSTLNPLKRSVESPGGGQTFRTLALVASSVYDRCKILLLTSDGLDPMGMKELNATVKQNVERLLVLHFYFEGFALSVEADAEFSQVIVPLKA